MVPIARGVLAAVFLGAASLAQGQAWPVKPIRFILSQPPGTGPDIISRLMSDKLSKVWGQPVVIENRAGGNNVIGAQAAARHYFNKPAAQLTPWESARLAVMLPRPRYFEKLPQSPYLAERSQIILSRMGAAVLP